ncbi:unnamed protein product, partial [Prunus brigantina]
MIPKQNCSPTWKGIMFGAQLLDKGVIWRLGKGDKVKFWRDKWISDMPLMQTVDLAPDLNLNSLVSDFFLNGWKKSSPMSSEFEGILQEIVPAITAIMGTNGGANKVQVLLAWVPPEIDMVKLNIDGSRRGSTGAIGAGGVLRDHWGQWIGGFAVNLGQGEVIEAELWGLFFGLNLAVEKKLDDIVIEMDSDTAVILIQIKVLNDCHPNAGLISSCKRLMNLFRRIKLQHVYRER